MLLLLVIMWPDEGMAQPPFTPFNGGIELDPYPRTADEVPCVQYTRPGTTFSVWDWRTSTYRIVFYPGNSTVPSTREVYSPFHAYFTNTAHLAFHPGEGNDYEPADGWELLYYKLGSEHFPVDEPSFVPQSFSGYYQPRNT